MADQHDDLARSLLGDGEAYARIVARHQQDVARRLRLFARQPLELEELVQEVFVEAYYSLPKFRSEGPLAAWLDRIATRVGYRHWKQLGRRREVARDDAWWREVGGRTSETSSTAKAAEIVKQLLDQLPPRDRLITLMLYVEGRTIAEAAELAGWSQTMVKVQAFRARGKLKKILSQAGIESIAALAAGEISHPVSRQPGDSSSES